MSVDAGRFTQVTIPPGIVLPYYARVDLAFQQTIDNPGGVSVSSAIHRVGPNLEVELAITCQVLTSAVAGNRVPFFWISDQNSALLAQVPSPVTQPPSDVIRYTWQYGIGAGWGATFGVGVGTQQGGYIMPLPPIVLLPGYNLGVGCYGAQVGDSVQNIDLTFINIPTGPPIESERPAQTLMATPILV